MALYVHIIKKYNTIGSQRRYGIDNEYSIYHPIPHGEHRTTK